MSTGLLGTLLAWIVLYLSCENEIYILIARGDLQRSTNPVFWYLIDLAYSVVFHGFSTGECLSHIGVGSLML